MITLRFEAHKNESYGMYSCQRYNVSIERCQPETDEELQQPTLAPMRSVIRMFGRSLNNDNPYYESVGEREPHHVCYVMNESGKTIDTIR